MNIKIKRIYFADTYTIGRLYINDIYFCDTLEDKDRDYNADGDLDDNGEKKVYGQTAIPYRKYKMVLDYSPHFDTIMPHILDVPEFEGIRIHYGNIPSDTLGCILVGKNTEKGKVTESRATYIEFIKRLLDAETKNYTIEICR
jgi:hypothetical protein